MPQIRVSEQVKDDLQSIKENNGHTSIDSAIREVLYGNGRDASPHPEMQGK